MFARYLGRELRGRRRQTVIIASALALAIGLVVVVNALSVGVRDAQAEALGSVYGVGTDITVTASPKAPGDNGFQPPRFSVGSNDGSTNSSGTRTVNQSRLVTSPRTGTFTSTVLTHVASTSGVTAAAGVLELRNISFSGQLRQGQQQDQNARPTPGASPGTDQGQTSPAGPRGSFGFDQFSVMGVDSASAEVGPLSSATVKSGRLLTAGDAGKRRAVLDASRATTEDKKVGDTISLGGKAFTIVGIVTGSGSDGSTVADAYVPLGVAQKLSDNAATLSTIYVRANSASDIGTLQAALEKAVPKENVNTQADLASSVSGSLSTASSLVTSLGTWLSIAVLVAAFLLASLLTLSGVSRRTRELGTLKALGWSNGRIIRQVGGESLVQALIGGAAGIGVGLAGIGLLNAFSPNLTASATGQALGPAVRRFSGEAGTSGAAGARGGFGPDSLGSVADVALHAPLTPWVLGIAVGIAVLGGLLAGIVGGWRAARLRPADALRSVA